jgi:AraC-like DNA-binding protein
MTYWERPSGTLGAVLWARTVGPAPEPARILPDGCMDLIWDGSSLFIAGPDSAARLVHSAADTSYFALRFSGGTGPALLGVPADQVLNQSPDLECLWPSGEARVLAERVAASPVAALERWAAERAASRATDPLGPRVMAMAAAGAPVATIADQLGLSARQLHRRCLPVFGYGPRRLARVLRLGRAIDEARRGAPLALVAAGCGYADQAHLSREVLALAGTTPTSLLRELARQRGEEVHGRAVGITEDGVTHPPEGVPWGEVAVVAGPGDLGPRRVNVGRAVARESQRRAVTGSAWS